MGEPFKNLINERTVAWLAERLTRAWPKFPAAAFRKDATRGLSSLELKARARHLADALERHLPAEPAKAFRLIVRSFEDPHEVSEGASGSVFRYLAFSEYLERHGPRDVKAALVANYELTQRFSSEFCIRPLILAAWPEVKRSLERWVRDDNEHVRRLVSEGTRPRLPWGRQLTHFVADPSPVLPLLEHLKDDPSEYVRRSVANNLNDIAKDHPEVVLSVARKWLRGASAERRRLVEHGLRTLLKRGDARALALLGADGRHVEASGSLSPSKVKVGERVVFSATVENRGPKATHVVVEARVHFVKMRGASAKPFRIARLDLKPGERRELSKSFLLEHRSIRRLFSGRHEVELQVNGARQPLGAFDLDAS
jgi:3-methyladenine DNA glycosylase AlkC